MALTARPGWTSKFRGSAAVECHWCRWQTSGMSAPHTCTPGGHTGLLTRSQHPQASGQRGRGIVAAIKHTGSSPIDECSVGASRPSITEVGGDIIQHPTRLETPGRYLHESLRPIESCCGPHPLHVGTIELVMMTLPPPIPPPRAHAYPSNGLDLPFTSHWRNTSTLPGSVSEPASAEQRPVP
jgi:hypothetical protein